MKLDGSVLVPLAEGFEEIEAVTIIDVLRRAGCDVVVAGLRSGDVRGAHDLVLGTDVTLDEVDAGSVGALVLPGGMPGTTHLAADERILDLVRALESTQKPVAAICAAPMVLARAGVLEGRSATSHPSVRDRLAGAQVSEERVVDSDRVITSQGPGTSLEFALGLVARFVGEKQAADLAEAMCVAAPIGAR